MTIEPLPAVQAIASYELRFQSLFHTGRGLSFPCDPTGEVQWDSMNDSIRASFLRAQQAVGREYASPLVRIRSLH